VLALGMAVAVGRRGISKSLLKHFSRSSSSLRNLQSVMIFAGGGFGFGAGGTMAS
jgi:hypothetical protein